MCFGFWPHLLHVRADVIVYANKRVPINTQASAAYYTGICGQHKPAKTPNDKDAEDLRQLGPGREPSTSQAAHSQ